MSRLAPEGPRLEPGGASSLLLAFAVHVAFFSFLVFAVSWRTEPPQGMVAELWTSLPATAPQPAPPPAPRPEAKPEPPKPAPPPPEPKAEPKPEPKPEIKPDISLKEKQEQEKKKRAEEEKKKQEAEKRKLEQQKAVEAERLKREQVKQQQELARLAREQEALNQQLQAQAAAGQSRLMDDYRGRIVAKIKRNMTPPEVPGNPEAVFDVVLLPSGEVLSAKLKKSSGHPAYDQAVERAILKAQPLPLPPDPALFANFRNLELKFRPQE